MNDVISGQVNVAVLGAAAVLPHIKSGKLVALAVSTKRRSAILPDTPTLSESGAGDIDVPQWSALLRWKEHQHPSFHNCVVLSMSL